MAVLFDDDARERVAWQADTRLRYLDEIPAVRERYAQRTEQLTQLAKRRVLPRHG